MEVFHAQRIFGPCGATGGQAIQQALRAARINLRAGIRLGQQRRVIRARAFVFDVDVHAVAVQRRKFVQHRHAGA
ncbi:hypothetical protein D3C71_1787480 [compost metagenome]